MEFVLGAVVFGLGILLGAAIAMTAKNSTKDEDGIR